jgi:Xaa-Pro dipeptidase
MTDRLSELYPAHIATVAERHDRALRESGYDHAVISGGALHDIFLDDMTYPFKVNPHFKSWVPVVDNPHCFIVYTPGSKPRLVYYQPVDYWYKVAGTPKGYWVGHFDIHVIADPNKAKDLFPSTGRTAFLGEPHETIKAGDVNPQPLLERLHWERSWKTDYEIECIRQANVKGARGHKAAEHAFRAGATEYEIHIEYLRASDQAEDELPYNNIIALNENAAVLHYHGHDRRKLQPYSFLIDAGASVNGYASDITRTYSRNGDEFGALIQAMDGMQLELCAAVKPGVSYPEIHMTAHRKIAAILAKFGFVKLDAEAIVAKGISSAFFPHGVGHFLGLQVHDVAGFMADPSGKTIAKPEGHPYLRLTRKVEPRMVFTIEPGLYFIEPLLAELQKSENAKHIDWPKVDSFRKYGGVRIEDNVVVTESGHDNLTRAAFGSS